MKPTAVAVMVMLVASLLAWLEFAAPGSTSAAGTLARHLADVRSESVALLPLPPPPELPQNKVALGKRLFFEKRLSHDDTLSCASCHDFKRGGTDRRPVSTGIGGKVGPINAPSVFNAALNFVQFWDGRAASLEEQAAGPVHNPLEMGSNWQEAIPKLLRDDSYRAAFASVYPGTGITGESIVDAIAAYERTLLTPSRFDRYLGGELSALTENELQGYRLFLNYGCASCHQGAGIGGNMFQRFGIMGDYFRDRPFAAADQGRFNVTQREEDRHVFKVPSLRNVAVTAPYFHDSSAKTLEEAIAVMAKYQLGRDLPGADIAAVAAFLRTLTGQWEGRMLE